MKKGPTIILRCDSCGSEFDRQAWAVDRERGRAERSFCGAACFSKRSRKLRGIDDIKVEHVRDLFTYYPETGLLERKDGKGSPWKRPVVATTGYEKASVLGIDVHAHRVIWMYMTGSWPNQNIDHINGNSRDNRWSNLRDVPQQMNVENMRRATSRNATGLLGVQVNRKRPGSFYARIFVHGRSVFLGRYETPELAHAAYIAAKRNLHNGCTI